ncbi:MAG: ferritin-like domain-containing protein [Cellulosilyticaceae bacterium]
MSNLSAKELSAVNELLAGETQFIKKFQMLSESSTDPELKEKFSQISQMHQGHFDAMYQYLQ